MVNEKAILMGSRDSVVGDDAEKIMKLGEEAIIVGMGSKCAIIAEFAK